MRQSALSLSVLPRLWKEVAFKRLVGGSLGEAVVLGVGYDWARVALVFVVKGVYSLNENAEWKERKQCFFVLNNFLV